MNDSHIDSRTMPSDSLIRDPGPLQPDHHPASPIDRKDELGQLERLLLDIDDIGRVNLHLSGPHGCGKTMLATNILSQLPDSVRTGYVDCKRFDTEYKGLRRICQSLTSEEIKSGYHTSRLQRVLENQIGHVQSVVLLDDVDFLLLNDGDDLLYYLSRFEHCEELAVITVSSTFANLRGEIEERTYSSLQPQKVDIHEYDSGTVAKILSERAEDSLESRTLHRGGLQEVAEITANISLGLIWLEVAAKYAAEVVTRETVYEVRKKAFRRYIEYQLQTFSQHHNLAIQAIWELSEEAVGPLQTGQVYNRYQELCETYSEDPLTDRRISDFLKTFELLGLVDAEYHYGGSKGKTREITLQIDEVLRNKDRPKA